MQVPYPQTELSRGEDQAEFDPIVVNENQQLSGFKKRFLGGPEVKRSTQAAA